MLTFRCLFFRGRCEARLLSVSAIKRRPSPLPNMRDMGSASTELFFQDALRCKCYLPSSYRQWDPKVPATLVATGVESDEPSFMYDPVLSLCTRIQEPASGK